MSLTHNNRISGGLNLVCVFNGRSVARVMFVVDANTGGLPFAGRMPKGVRA